MINFYEAKAANKRKSFLVVLLFTIFVTLTLYILIKAFNVYYGYQIGSLGIFGFALIISGATSYFSYYFSDKIVLAISRLVCERLRQTNQRAYAFNEALQQMKQNPQP